LPTRKVAALLAYLALHPEQHAREKLAALCWGDSSDAQARASLRTALNALRKQAGESVVVADRLTVQLNPAQPMWVDALAFAHLAGSDSSGDWQTAVELYQGDLLPDFYDEWIMLERERLREQYVQTRLWLAGHKRAQSD